MLRFNLSFLAVSFLLLQNACDPDTGDSDSATGSTSTSGESTTDASTTDDAPTASATTEDSTTSQEEPTTTTGDDTEGGTSGPVDPEHQSACEAFCEQAIACGGGGDETADCVLNCTSEFQEIDAECVPNHFIYLECNAKLLCDPFAPVEEACAEAFEAHVICGNEAEECMQTTHEGGEGVCGLGLSCPDLPTYEISCEGDTCVCLQDGVEVAQCPADDVCAQGDAIFDKLDECCAGV